LGTIQNGLAAARLELGAQPKRKKFFNNLSLRRYGHRCATSASPGILNGKVKWHRTGFAFQQRLTAGFEKASHRVNAPRSHRTVQRGGTVLVLTIDIRASIEQTSNCCHLPFSVPSWPINVAIGSVVQWAAAAMIRACVRLGTGGQK